MQVFYRVGEELFAFQEALCTEEVSYLVRQTFSWSVGLIVGWLISCLVC